MNLDVIHYNDPEGRQLDLIRIIRRTIHNNMPEGYKGDVPDVKQDVTFTREELIDDNGNKSFTEWHSENPYWSEYVPEQITGYEPSTELINSKKLDENSNNEEVNVNYSLRNESRKKQEKEIAQSEKESTEKARKNTTFSPKKSSNDIKEPKRSQDSVTITKKEYEKLRATAKEKSKVVVDTETGEILSKPKKTQGTNNSQSKVQPIHLFKAPRQTQLVELDRAFIKLGADKSVAEILEQLRIIGYFYLRNGKWIGNEFIEGALLKDI